MLAISRFFLFPAAFLCLSGFFALAQTDNAVRDIKAAPGKDTRVGVYTNIAADCTTGPLPSIRLAVAPAHGTVHVRRGSLKATNFKQCLAIEAPALIALYHAADNFNGTDEFDLEIIFAGGRKQMQHFRVNVAGNPAGGQGI
ncbi:MAG TPA: hypothetical protein VEJ37_10870 [Xanthobacteraceae bacterium]|nr:hypothetical protein [Xanthobacteraceae bacterium]